MPAIQPQPQPQLAALPCRPVAASESLVGSLCREMERLRSRWRQARSELLRCREEALSRRLAAELAQLQQRRLELQQAARELGRRGLRDRLALAFLHELTRRPLPC